MEQCVNRLCATETSYSSNVPIRVQYTFSQYGIKTANIIVQINSAFSKEFVVAYNINEQIKMNENHMNKTIL